MPILPFLVYLRTTFEFKNNNEKRAFLFPVSNSFANGFCSKQLVVERLLFLY